MQKISLGDRDYVKASAVAKQFKYTQDYVGQLCRSDKVDCRLVGRIWYVNIDSVKSYRKTKHTVQKNATKNITAHYKAKKRSSVDPVVRNKTVRMVKGTSQNRTTDFEQKVKTRYMGDDSASIPMIRGASKPVVDSVERSEKVKVQKVAPKVKLKVTPNTKKSTVYKTSKLPEITLKAKLNISDYSNDYPSSESSPEQIVDNKKSIVSQPGRKVNSASESSPIVGPVTTTSAQNAGQERLAEPKAKPVLSNRKTPYAMCLLAFVVAGLVLTLGQSTIVGGDGVTNTFFLSSPSNVLGR